MRAQRLALPDAARTMAAQAALHHFMASGLLARPYRCVAGYCAVRGELDILPIMDYIATMGALCALPAIDTDGHMRFRTWDGAQLLTTGRYGIPAPAEGDDTVPDLILLPLLACDRDGVRLGAGGGYYDRTLSNPRYRHAYRLGIGFHFQLLPHLPSEAHDVRVHGFLSEEGLMTCEPFGNGV